MSAWRFGSSVISRGLMLSIRCRMPCFRLYYGPKMTSSLVRGWLEQVGAKTWFIEPGSPWDNGYNESFNGKPRDECLNAEILYSLKDAQVVIKLWRRHCNTRRLHSALGYRPPSARNSPSSITETQCSKLAYAHMRWTKISVRSVSAASMRDREPASCGHNRSFPGISESQSGACAPISRFMA